MTFITKAAAAAVAASFAFALASSAPASAQASLTNGPNGTQPNTLRSNNKARLPSRRPLTVRRSGAPVVAAAVAAPVAAAGSVVANPISGTLGVANTLVGLPFQVIGGILPNTTLKGGVTNVRYEGARDKVAEIDEGFATPVPVNRSGPVFVVENGDPTVSPLVFFAVPVRGVGAAVQTPLKVLASPFGG